MPINARSVLVDLPNGSFDQDGGDVKFQAGKVSFRSLVVDAVDPTMNALIQELGKGRNILRARLRDGITDWVTWAKVTSVQRVATPLLYKCEQPVTVNWDQDYPFWMNAADGIYFDTGYYFDAGALFDGKYEDQSVTTSPHTFTITNDGTVETGMGTVIIVPNAASSITNPHVVNNTNGMGFKYTGVVNAGEQLVIDFLTRTAEKAGVNVYGTFTLDNTTQVSWMQLELGANSVSLYSDAIAGTVKWYWQWKRHYL